MRALLLSLLLFCTAAAAAPAPRAIWMWEEDSYALLERPADAAGPIAFLRSKSITTLFLYADAFDGRNLIVTQPQLYRTLVRRLHGEGIKVYALLGSAYLNTERYVLPERRADALAMVQRVLDYNAASAPEERFDGANLDIEPHIMPEWGTRKEQLLKDFIEMSEAVMAAKRRSGQALLIGPAIPFWLDGIQLAWRGERRPVSEFLQDQYDYVALMDYRDRAAGGDGIISHAMDEMHYAQSIGRKVWVGVETMPNSIKKVSFEHLREADMERELAAAQQDFAPSPAFLGFAVHHYGSYRKWLSRQGR
ncbi:hypothetical protein [Pseudoduganella rhizocola]|uniref:hypothetical protein n=1 Tax=Pseudoduganella rhizocola TaxID=3382643 RepID=UPI0038B5D5AC